MFLGFLLPLGLGRASCLTQLQDDLKESTYTGIISQQFLPESHSAKEPVKEYKNSPRAFPATVDLSHSYELTNKVFIHDQSSTAQEVAVWKPSHYELEVASLKKGDTIVFDGKKFKLGNFLGRGNETHVWEIEGHPDEVIRLPFSVSSLRKDGATGYVHTSILFRENLSMISDSQYGVKIFDRDEGNNRYAVVQKVHGDENGSAFLKRVSLGEINVNNSRGIFHTRDLQKIFDSGKEGAALKNLFDIMSEEQMSSVKLDSENDAAFSNTYLDNLRQYMWDVKEQRWYRVDGR